MAEGKGEGLGVCEGVCVMYPPLLSQLAPNEKFSLNTTLVFVCTGSYQLQPVCCVPGATAYPTSGGVAVREWAQLLGVQPSLPDDDLMQQMLTETMSDVILGTSTEVHNKR